MTTPVPPPLPNEGAEKLWYYTDAENQPVGPVAFAMLKHLGEQGLIRPVDYVREKGSDEWVPFQTIQERTPRQNTSVVPPPLPSVDMVNLCRFTSVWAKRDGGGVAVSQLP
ncbi:MAG: DUF4339 domain-containing protein [Chthoniobacter sp.]